MFGAQGLVSRNTQTNGLSSAGTLWYAFDERGNVSQRTGGNGGVASSDLYDAFGNVTSTGGPDVFGFGGQAGYYTDAETGLILCTHRHYDPQQGRFLTRDPLGYDGGINLYGYTANNPINGLDPSGLDPTLLSDMGDGFATGWAGWSTAVWNVPGLSNLNQKYGIYSAGSYANDPSFGTSVQLGNIGISALEQAGGMRALTWASAAGRPLQFVGNWWNKGAEADGAFAQSGARGKFANEVGNNTVSDAENKAMEGLTTQEKAAQLMSKGPFGWFPKSAGFLTKTFGTGPTAGVRAYGKYGYLGLSGEYQYLKAKNSGCK